MPASSSLLLLLCLLLCFAPFIVRWQSVLLHSKKTKTKQDKNFHLWPTRHKISITSPLSFSPSLCLSAKNSWKLFINALERNFLLSLRDHSLWILRSLSLSFSLLAAVQTPQQSRVNFLFAVFQFHNIPKRPCAQLTLTKTLWGLLLRCAALSQSNSSSILCRRRRRCAWNAIEQHLLLMLRCCCCCCCYSVCCVQFSILFFFGHCPPTMSCSWSFVASSALHFCFFFFLLCLIYRIHLTQLSLSLLTIVIYVAHCSAASIPLSRSLSLSQSQTRCTAFQQVALQRWCGLHFWNCRSLSFALPVCLCLCLCAALLLSVLISVGQTHCVGAQWANIYAVVLLLFSFLFFFSPAAELLLLLLFLAFFYGFLFRCTCAKFKAALSSPYQRRRRRSLNS